MTESRTNSIASAGANELLVELDRSVGVALHRQVESGLRARIRAGRLPPGTVLPSTRGLATDLGVSRGVVVEAYEQLVAEGYLVSRTGGYTQVADAAASESWLTATATDVPEQMAIDFAYGRPDVSQFPRAAWLRSMRRVLETMPNDRLVYLEGGGAPELREALAAYLNRVRGTAARPENVVVCNGFGQGIRLVAQVLAVSGARTLAVEDPSSDDDIRVVGPRLGLKVVGVPVGDGGLDVSALDQARADAVLVTAAHQFPTGTVLSAEARKSLVAWASRRDAVIVEDDYDAEFRYDREPIGAIQGLSADRVVYAGTASKTLAPGLRLGWLVVPDRLLAEVKAAKLLDDRGSPVLDQLAFADFVSRGEFDRHLRRMRPRYRRRRDALLDALSRRLPQLEPAGISAGMHVTAWLPAGVSEDAVVAAAAARGLGVYGVGPYRMSPGRPGLVFGYGNLSESAIRQGVDLLAAVWPELGAG
jgi:GntR family transcriptional regulator/MocR family aminotransferase